MQYEDKTKQLESQRALKLCSPVDIVPSKSGNSSIKETRLLSIIHNGSGIPRPEIESVTLSFKLGVFMYVCSIIATSLKRF